MIAGSERKSPTESATLYKIGTIRNGNDGNKWKIIETSNGTKRWQLARKSTRITARKSTRASMIKSKKAMARKLSRRVTTKNGTGQFTVKLKFYFTNTIARNLKNVIEHKDYAQLQKEKNPTDAEITHYLRSHNRAHSFIKYTIAKHGKVSSISVSNGVLSFAFTPKNKGLTKAALFNLLYNENLEGIFYKTSSAGNELVYPAKFSDEYELGLLDYRKKTNIQISEN
jgi:hypothetical protein